MSGFIAVANKPIWGRIEGEQEMSIHQPSTKRSNKSGRGLRVTLPAVVVAALLISPASTARAHSLWPHTSDIGIEQPSTTVQSAAPSQFTITISSQWITPTSATVSAGIVHLTIKNQSSQEQLTLRVSRENGSGVVTELELGQPGQYVITAISSTSGSCQIKAQAPPQES
jgi:hypothetical protein